MTLRRWTILSVILLVPGFVLQFLSRTVFVPEAGVIGGLLLAAGLAIQLFVIRCPECGDTLFAGSCGRTDFPGGSMEKMMASLRRLGQLEGDLRVLPGHMEASTLDRERRWNPYLLQAMQ